MTRVRPARGGLRIRRYGPEDHPRVVALWQACGLRTGPSDAADAIARMHVPGCFLVASLGPEVVGTVMGHVDRAWGWVNRLAVHPEWRRQGLARRLMAEIERELIGLGAAAAHLLTHEQNKAALSLYQALGYTAHRQIVYLNKDLVEPDAPAPRQDPASSEGSGP